MLSGATEGRIDIGVARAEPVSERRPQKLARRGWRRAFHHEVLAVEEICGVLGIRRHGAEAWKGRKLSAGPLPAVADEILDAPRARSFRMTPRGLGIPAREIEDAVLGGRRLLAPRML